MQGDQEEILGKYRIVRELGRGGTGVVYLAFDTELERNVALKRLHPALSKSSAHAEHFRQEAKVLAGMRHPYVVPVHAFMEVDSVLYIEMAFIPGRSLRQVLCEDVLSVDVSIQMIRDILAALVACHNAGIFHCDLKPSNILIDDRGKPNLVDFGWASKISEGQGAESGQGSMRDTHAVGTPSYSPPECWENESPSAQWDLYGLGVVAAEMLLGFPPDSGANLHALTAGTSRVPVGFGDWISQMMARGPANRFSSATDALQALEEIADDYTEARARSLSETTVVRRRACPGSRRASSIPRTATRAFLVLAAVLGLGWPLINGGNYLGLPASNSDSVRVASAAQPPPDPDEQALPPSGAPEQMRALGNVVFFSASLDGAERSLMVYNVESTALRTLIPALIFKGANLHIEPFPDGGPEALAQLRHKNGEHEVWALSETADAVKLQLNGLYPPSSVNIFPYRGDLVVAIHQESSHDYNFYSLSSASADPELFWKSSLDFQMRGPGIGGFAPIDDRLSIAMGVGNTGLWRFTGERSDSGPLLNGRAGPIRALLSWRGAGWAVVDSPDYGGELWRTDGTEGGTRLFVDLRPGPDGAFTYDRDPGFRPAGEWLVFAARTDEYGLELWRTNGTVEGTVLIRDMAPGTADSDPFQWTTFQNHLYFSAVTLESGRELWVTDGTTEGTRMVADIWPGQQSGEPYALIATDAGLFFSADDGTHGEELWLLRNADAAPVLVTDLYPGAEGSEPYEPVAIDGGILFAATTPEVGRELYFSDGTEKGTRLLLDIAKAPEDPAKEIELLAMNSPEFGAEPAIRVGDAKSPELLLDIIPGPKGSNPSGFFALDGLAYFTAEDKIHGRELWVTDFTTEGTRLAANINIGEFSSNPREIMASGGEVYFVAECRDRGTELWRLDAPNRRAFALESVGGPGSSNPTNFRVLGQMLVFDASDGHGNRISWEVGAGMEYPRKVNQVAHDGVSPR